MAKKKKILPWFKVYSANLGVIKGIEDPYKVGLGIIAAMEYVNQPDDEETIKAGIEDPITLIAYNTFKQGVDESIQYYKDRVEDGRNGWLKKLEEAEKRGEEKARQKYIQDTNLYN